jgi:heme-degrading monooxygenase HmoA
MIARVFTIQVIPEKMEAFIQRWHDSMLPLAKEQKGWKSARLLVDRQSGKVVIVGMWQTEADALATGAGTAHAEKQRAFLEGLISAPPVIENFEVAADV